LGFFQRKVQTNILELKKINIDRPTNNGRTLKMLKVAFKSSKNIQKLDLICPQHAQMTEKGIHIIGENIKKLKSLK